MAHYVSVEKTAPAMPDLAGTANFLDTMQRRYLKINAAMVPLSSQTPLLCASGAISPSDHITPKSPPPLWILTTH